jgi:hypothetical protein
MASLGLKFGVLNIEVFAKGGSTLLSTYLYLGCVVQKIIFTILTLNLFGDNAKIVSDKS